MNADQPLVDAVLANDPGAFERLVREHTGLCWHIIFRMVRHPEDARDLCQEAFLRVYRHLGQFRYESALKSWIGQIAYSVALRHLERKRIPLVEAGDDGEMTERVENVGADVDVEALCADEQVGRLLTAALEALAPLPRTIVTLYHLEDLSLGEIAAITGHPIGTIKSHLFRSRLRLRDLLEPLLADTR